MEACNTVFTSLLLFNLIFGLQNVYGEVIKGVVPLNSGTFDKIVSRFQVVLVKFDESYPYGEKHDVFKQLAEATLSQENLLLGEVNIADYGDKDNSELGERFGAKKEDFPVYKLFSKDTGLENPIDFTGDKLKLDDLKRFLIKETGIWLGLPACIEEFDRLSKEFLQTSSDQRKELLQKAEKIASEITEEPKKTRAAIYVKTMQKIIEKGDEFVNNELKRVEKLADGKVSENKKTQLKDRASILTSFQLSMKDEL